MTVRSGRLGEIDNEHITQKLIAGPLSLEAAGVGVHINQGEVGDDLGSQSTVLRRLTAIGPHRLQSKQNQQKQKSHAFFIEQQATVGDFWSVTETLLGRCGGDVYKGSRIPPA